MTLRRGRRTALPAACRALAAILALGMLTGCLHHHGTSAASTAASTTPSTSAAATTSATAGPGVPGITALAYRTRIDVATSGQFQVQVRNTGTEPFTVLGAALDSPGFTRLPPSSLETLFRPGATIDLLTRYGAVQCGDGVSAEPAYAVLDLRRPDGTVEQVRVPMPSESQTVPNMYAEECAAQALAASVAVTLDGLAVEQVDGLPTVTGALNLQRGESTESIAVVDMRGSVVLQVRPLDTELPAVMAAEETSLTVPIQVRQATCDPHYLADTKQPVLFPLWISLGGGEQEYSEIPVDADQRVFLINYLGDVCN